MRSPGRLEVVGRQPLVLLDGAHNVAGAEALRAALDEEFAPAARTLVVGLLREKEPHEMLTALGLDDVAQLVCCAAAEPARARRRRSSPRPRWSSASRAEHIEVVDTVAEAVSSALLLDARRR